MSRFLTVAVVSLLWLTAGCATPADPSATPLGPGAVKGNGKSPSVLAPALDASDRVLHGIRLGMAEDEAKALLESPVHDRSLDSDDESWRQGDEVGVSFSFRNGIVWQVRDSLGPTPRGLAIDDPENKVRQLYGDPADINKHGWWRYVGKDGLILIIAVRDGLVKNVTIEDQRVAEPMPDDGRQVPGNAEKPAFGAQDYALAGVEACSLITDLRADSRFQETLGSAERGTLIGFITADKYMRVDPAESDSLRADSIEVTGGGYETARGVRVGDPLSRVEALYGGVHLADDNVALDFLANINYRIEKIVLTCIRPGPALPSKLQGSSENAQEIRFTGILVGTGDELIIKYGTRVFSHKLDAGAQLLQGGSPISKSDLRPDVRVDVTVRNDKIVRLEVLTPPSP